MNIREQSSLRQRLKAVQVELIAQVSEQEGMVMTPKLERLIHILDYVRVEEFVAPAAHLGRPEHPRYALANAFVAKAVLRIETTAALIERLQVDRSLRRICGFEWFKKLPDESTFSRAFAQFAQEQMAQRVHEALIKEQLGEQLIGHVSRDGTAIEVRERPAKKQAEAQVNEQNKGARKRGRPRRGEERAPKDISRIERQRGQSVQQMLDELPKACDRGAKCNAQGYKNSWNGYKLHLDTADCGVPLSAVLTSASVHDSQVAIPLSRLTAQRVDSLYDVMDAAYCSVHIREDSRAQGHVPLIDHNPRGGIKQAFAAHEVQRYKERTVSERMNARLKDEFGDNQIWVRGHVKVMCHLMFGVLVLSADQLLRLLS